MKTLARKLVLHVLILCGMGLLFCSYHLLETLHGPGEWAFTYFFLLLVVEWPLGAFVGGLISVRTLKLQVSLRAYAGYGLGLGIIFYSAAMATCIGLEANPVGWAIGGLTLPIISCLIVSAHERDSRPPPA